MPIAALAHEQRVCKCKSKCNHYYLSFNNKLFIAAAYK